MIERIDLIKVRKQNDRMQQSNGNKKKKKKKKKRIKCKQEEKEEEEVDDRTHRSDESKEQNDRMY